MDESTPSRPFEVAAADPAARSAGSVLEALKTRGFILIVKGRGAALEREIAAPLRDAWDEFARGADESRTLEVVRNILATIRNSDHVEDVFAAEEALRTETLRIVQQAVGTALRHAPLKPEICDVSVRLQELGYVARSVAKKASESSIKIALGTAVQDFGGELLSYDHRALEALFRLTTDDPDVHLELEDAVADELAALVNGRAVDLPILERRVDIGKTLSPQERQQFRPRIDVLATRTLSRSGCATAWDFADDRTIRVSITPLSEQDALQVDKHVGNFSRELAALVSDPFGHEPREARPQSQRLGASAPIPEIVTIAHATRPTPAPAPPAPLPAATPAVAPEAVSRRRIIQPRFMSAPEPPPAPPSRRVPRREPALPRPRLTSVPPPPRSIAEPRTVRLMRKKKALSETPNRISHRPATSATPSKAPPPRKATPSKAPPPRKATPSKVPPPRKATPSKVPPPRKATPSKAPPPRKATPSKVPPPRKGTPSKAPPPRKATPSKVPPPRKATPSKAPPPRKTTPSKAHKKLTGTTPKQKKPAGTPAPRSPQKAVARGAKNAPAKKPRSSR